MKPIATGAIQSPIDYRDGIAASAFPVPNTPSSLNYYRYSQIDNYPVLMQNLTPACVAHSLALLVQDYFYRKTGQTIDFSPRWIDALMKTVDGQPLATGGAIPQLGLKLLAKYGCATEATCPNNTLLPILQYRDPSCLTTVAYSEAAQYKIPGYVKIPTDVQSLRNAIYFFGLVSILKHVGDEWYTASNGIDSWSPSDIDPIRTPNPITSGHQTTDFGWNGTLNKLRNSWSKAWDINGNADYDVNAWQPFEIEAWAIAEIPSDTLDFLHNLPSEANFHYQWNTDMVRGTGPTDDIRFCQIALMILGYMTPPAIDQLGLYGPRTAAALLAYQLANNVPGAAALGGSIAGSYTRQVLNSRFAL